MAISSLDILAMAAAEVQSYAMLQASHEFRIRAPQFSDIPLLALVERSAAVLFQSANLGHRLDGPTVDPNLLLAMAKTNHLWIAANNWDQPIGFICGKELDSNFHIVEISVAKDWQGRGVGKVLMTTMMQQVQEEKFSSITLTTYRSLPWNGLWYSKLGFMEVNAEDMGAKYVALLDTERQHGLDITKRCVMRKNL